MDEETQNEAVAETDEKPQDIVMSGGLTLPSIGAGNG